jgi:hypothetical protein
MMRMTRGSILGCCFEVLSDHQILEFSTTGVDHAAHTVPMRMKNDRMIKDIRNRK